MTLIGALPQVAGGASLRPREPLQEWIAVFGTLSGILPHIKSGKLKAIAVTSRQRSALIPDVATIAESGFSG